MPLGGSWPIPAQWNSLDEACYPLAGGEPSASWLGKNIGDNDRLIHAQMRRRQTQAFSFCEDSTSHRPVVGGIAGVDMGVWDLPWTYGATRIEWTILCNVEWDGVNGMTMYALPYTVGGPQDDGWVLGGAGNTPTAMVGAASAYGTRYTCYGKANKLGRYGLALYSTINVLGATFPGVATGQVFSATPDSIWSTSPAPNPMLALAAAGSFWAIRLTAGVGGAAYTPWLHVRQIVDSPAGTNDMALISGVPDALRAYMMPHLPVLGWEARRVSACQIQGIMLREMPLTGTLRGESF